MVALFVLFTIILPDIYLFYHLPKWFKSHIWFKVLYWTITFIFILLVFKLYLSVSGIGNYKQAQGFMWSIWTWMLLYFSKIIYLIITVWRYPLKWFFKKNSFVFLHWLGLLLVVTFSYIMLVGTFYDRYNFRINYIKLSSEKLPKAFDGTRICQISDLHIGNLDAKHKILQKTTDLINREDVDYIFMTGDLVNNEYLELNNDNSDYLKNMKAHLGKYSILGNHDYGDYKHWNTLEEKQRNLDSLMIFEEKSGFKMLNNKAVVLRRGLDSIALIGVENWGAPPFPQYGNLHPAIDRVKAIPFKILLSHDPTHWDHKVKNKTDIFLTLSGHTHAMQFSLNFGKFRFSPACLKYKKWGGLYQENKQFLYVNEGIGYVFIPFRFGCGPEITIFQLERIESEEKVGEKLRLLRKK